MAEGLSHFAGKPRGCSLQVPTREYSAILESMAARRQDEMAQVAQSWVGRSIERVEDAALLTGRGRFVDDLGTPPGTFHAAILRSPHAHADILSIDAASAKTAPG